MAQNCFFERFQTLFITNGRYTMPKERSNERQMSGNRISPERRISPFIYYFFFLVFRPLCETKKKKRARRYYYYNAAGERFEYGYAGGKDAHNVISVVSGALGSVVGREGCWRRAEGRARGGIHGD